MSAKKNFKIHLVLTLLLVLVDIIWLSTDSAAPVPAFVFGMILADSARDTVNAYRKLK